MLARSVFMAPDGLALSQFGSYDSDDRTPFRRRWGGWYVTGDARIDAPHRQRRHDRNGEARGDRSPTARCVRIAMDALFDGRGYPSTHSDIVALMVFQHQAHMMNLITRSAGKRGSRRIHERKTAETAENARIPARSLR